MRRWTLKLAVLGLAGVLLVPETSAAQQSLNVFVGGFVPRKVDRASEGRFSNDILINNSDFLAFDLNDFNGPLVGADYLIGLNDYIDVGLGIGFYRRTVPSVYWDFVDEDGFEIEQDLRLRIVPLTATFRFLPLGHTDAFKPYVGAGIGAFAWRYTEVGDFVLGNSDVEFGSFSGSGVATGPVILGGAQFPLNGWDLGGEVRYQRAVGDLPTDRGFSADKVDLGGWSGLVTFNIRF
jgi:hypothetical protein